MIYELVERSRGGRSERGIFQSSNVVPFTKICSEFLVHLIKEMSMLGFFPVFKGCAVVKNLLAQRISSTEGNSLTLQNSVARLISSHSSK